MPQRFTLTPKGKVFMDENEIKFVHAVEVNEIKAYMGNFEAILKFQVKELDIQYSTTLEPLMDRGTVPDNPEQPSSSF